MPVYNYVTYLLSNIGNARLSTLMVCVHIVQPVLYCVTNSSDCATILKIINEVVF